MTDKVQKIRKEVVGIINSINLFTPYEDGKNSSYEAGKLDVASKILQVIDFLQKEPVSEDFENALAEEWKGYNDRGAAKVDALEDNTQELAFAKGFYRGWHYMDYDGLRKAVEGVSEELSNYINELSKQFPEVSFAKLSRIAVRIAKWQKQQDQSTIELAEDHAMLAGMEKMKEQMMAKAIDGVARPYDNEIWCILDSFNLEDGDKVKVIVIKKDLL